MSIISSLRAANGQRIIDMEWIWIIIVLAANPRQEVLSWQNLNSLNTSEIEYVPIDTVEFTTMKDLRKLRRDNRKLRFRLDTLRTD